MLEWHEPTATSVPAGGRPPVAQHLRCRGSVERLPTRSDTPDQGARGRTRRHAAHSPPQSDHRPDGGGPQRSPHGRAPAPRGRQHQVVRIGGHGRRQQADRRDDSSARPVHASHPSGPLRSGAPDGRALHPADARGRHPEIRGGGRQRHRSEFGDDCRASFTDVPPLRLTAAEPDHAPWPPAGRKSRHNPRRHRALPTGRLQRPRRKRRDHRERVQGRGPPARIRRQGERLPT